ncbi:MAG: aminotransferase class IV [Clostridium sp.]
MRKITFDNNMVIIDDGIMFGRGVFETILVKNTPILFNEHIKRLNEGLSIIGINILDVNEIDCVKKTIKENNIIDMVFKIVVTENNIILRTRKNQYKSQNYLDGINLMISDTRRNQTSLLNGVKSLNYLENLLGKEQAISNGYNDVLFLNFNNEVCETSCANIFCVKDGFIMTPSIECGLLNGIIRSFIVKNFNVIEKKITLNELLKCDEIFITNSLMGVIKVNKINNKIYNNEKHSFLIRRFYENYINEIGGQEVDK